MNRQVVSAVIGGLLTGAGIGYAWAQAEAETKARKKYEAYSASLSRAMELARQQIAEKPATSEEELDTIFSDDKELTVGGEMVVEVPIATPDYIAAATQYASQDTFVPEMEYSISYIEDEEYNDDDGRPKEQISILMGSDAVPLFMQDGQVIEDWAEKIGDSILVDFYKRVPPGAERVLYVRNSARDEDYEVIQENV